MSSMFRQEDGFVVACIIVLPGFKSAWHFCSIKKSIFDTEFSQFNIIQFNINFISSLATTYLHPKVLNSWIVEMCPFKPTSLHTLNMICLDQNSNSYQLPSVDLQLKKTIFTCSLTASFVQDY